MKPTLEELLETFTSHLEGIEGDTAAPDPEDLFIQTVVAELKAIQLGFIDVPGGEELSLIYAVTRIPGILHLYKLY